MNIPVFLNTYFPVDVLGFYPHTENLAQKKPLYLHVLCSVQLCLWGNLGTAFFLSHFSSNVEKDEVNERTYSF